MTEIVDLRSDTLTQPSPAMRQAMMDAPVGDDVFGEDPTITALQEKAAEMLGKEAALFVPSGTMANQISLKVLTNPGEEVIMEAGAHPYMYEGAGASIISSVQLHTIPGHRGVLDPKTVESALRPTGDPHQPPTRLVCIENTSNRGGGTIYPLETIQNIAQIAQSHGLAMHMDGARLFNAVVGAGVSAAEYANPFDTISFCLSKGLGAPVGSLVVSSKENIGRAIRWRKVLGGGMRQAGILAAAGLFALENNIERLAMDHENAQILAKGFNAIDGLSIDPGEVDTNIVIFKVTRPGLTPPELCAKLNEKGIRVLPFGPDQIRAVTHLDVSKPQVEKAVEITAKVMAE